MLLNTVCNPLIYLATNNHFKEYCLRRARNWSVNSSQALPPSSPYCQRGHLVNQAASTPVLPVRGLSPDLVLRKIKPPVMISNLKN